MNTRVKVVAAVVGAVVLLSGAGSGCDTDADVASQNLSKAADQFEIVRRIIFLNGITDKYIMAIEGRCSIKDEGHQLDVT